MNILKQLIPFILNFCFCHTWAMDSLTLSINNHLFYLEVPTTAEESRHGLMFRRFLEPNHGMLFLFPPSDTHFATMWMKNTYLSLDLLFIGSDYKIICLIEHTKPLSLEHLSCPYPTTAVIELNAGDIKSYGLSIGMNLSTRVNAS